MLQTRASSDAQSDAVVYDNTNDPITTVQQVKRVFHNRINR